jgi:selenocysteine-specific elongation factor
VIVGTAGHIDHGKTALVRKLTGVETDRLKEEKARGISIDLGFAYWPRPNGAIVSFVDVPGHEGLVHTMLAGATCIDFVVLVVAADDGVMPQTREHVAIMDLLGLTKGVVALNKADLASKDRLDAVGADIEALLRGTGLEGAEAIPVSAVTGEGLDRLAARIDAAADLAPKRSQDGRFRLSVDRSFTLAGLGTTVTGTVLSGKVLAGSQVIVSPDGLEARVRSIHAENSPAEIGKAGQRCALVLSGPRISKDAIHRGDMALDPTLHAPAVRIDATLRLLKSEPKTIGHWFPVRLHHAASQTGGRLVLLSSEQMKPGGEGLVQIVLDKPIAAAAGDRYVLRDTTSSRTIGGGTFIDLRAPERKRRTPQRLARLQALAESDPVTALSSALNEPDGWIDLDSFFRDRAIGADAAAAIFRRLDLVTFPVAGGRAALLKPAWERFRSAILARLDAFHSANPDLPGIGFEELRRTTHQLLPGALFTAALRTLVEGGDVSLDRMWVRLPHHTIRLSPEEERLLRSVLRYLDAEPYRPPRVRDIAKMIHVDEDRVRIALRKSCRKGDVEEIAHDHFFARSAVEAMADIAINLSAHSPGGVFTAAQFRDRLDNGRKVAIQVLEYFDRHGFTIRRQDLRRANKARMAFFSSKQQMPV